MDLDLTGMFVGDAWWKGAAVDGMEFQTVSDTAGWQQVSSLCQSPATKLLCCHNADCPSATTTVHDMQVQMWNIDTVIFCGWKVYIERILQHREL